MDLGPGVDRTHLASHDVVPEIEWGSQFWNDWTTVSPASEYNLDEGARSLVLSRRSGMPSGPWGCPERPTTASRCGMVLSTLWPLRAQRLEGLDVLERFAPLDLARSKRLSSVCSCPRRGDASFASVPRVDRLVVFLEREGAHREARAIAGRLAISTTPSEAPTYCSLRGLIRPWPWTSFRSEPGTDTVVTAAPVLRSPVAEPGHARSPDLCPRRRGVWTED